MKMKIVKNEKPVAPKDRERQPRNNQHTKLQASTPEKTKSWNPSALYF